jgi:cellulose synthase/poly-beta-1,6-N-acetylglucosamine synthase-like glycosyltransferase
MLLEILFWTFLALILYTYVGYPILLGLLTLFKRESRPPSSKRLPKVSLVISAYNEARIIREKIENSLEIEYPKDKLEIVVVSDGSDDDTDSIVAEYENRGVRLLRRNHRAGKTSIQNFAVRKVNGQIIVFSDANAMYQSDAVKRLVGHFADDRVGCVCGELRYWNRDGSVAGDQENLYWSYEKYLKRKENLLGTILGANGSIYAVRKDRYVPLRPDIISDFIEPLKIVQNGYRVVYDPRAISYEQSSLSFKEEFQRKKRIVLRSLYSLLANAGLLNPLKMPLLSFELLSHKLLRWCVPFFMLGMLLVNVFMLHSGFYTLFFAGQIFFYLLAIAGYILDKKDIRGFLIYGPFYFVLVNLASFLAIIELIFGKRITSWQPARVDNPVEVDEKYTV